jgi:hypothetical protein
MRRKGISSVEEEICQLVANECNGISNNNNDSKSSLTYGMCKLDLDVRMLLPIPSVVEACRKKDITITG